MVGQRTNTAGLSPQILMQLLNQANINFVDEEDDTSDDENDTEFSQDGDSNNGGNNDDDDEDNGILE